jgi:N-acetylmuramoyl-L-alanine amidase
MENGWSGIGYHYVIQEDGTLEHGRPEYWVGAHCLWHNETTIGICLIGMGGDATESQLLTLRDIIRTQLHLRYPNAQVVGHCDLDPTNKPDCPGFDVKGWYYD